MHLNAFRQWMEQVYATQEEELDCDGVLDLIADYVDSEAVGMDSGALHGDVSQHLSQCGECHDLYLTLQEIAWSAQPQILAELQYH